MMLTDPRKQVVYVPVAMSRLPELAEWSPPVQVKVENGELIFRRLPDSGLADGTLKLR